MSNKRREPKNPSEIINLRQTNQEDYNNDDNENANYSNQLEEGECPRFPYPISQTNSLTRTDLNPAKQRWNKIKNDLNIGNEPSKLSSLVSNIQNKTKSFLGVDESKKVSRSRQNWNERRFKLLNKNNMYGGKLNQNKFAQYIEKIENITDSDTVTPLLYYKLSNGDKVDTDPTKNVSHIAMNGLRKMIPIKKQKNSGDVNVPIHFEAKMTGVDEVDEANLPGPCDAFTQAFSGQRMFGIGFCGRLFDNDLDPTKQSEYSEVLKTIKQHRPYFTYWITFVQIIICLVSIFAYGLAPIGFSYSLKKGLATTTNLEKRMITYPVKQNFWIGPEPMDLVHLGAKYAPCMRNDTSVYKAIQKDIDSERETACCIRNDRGGCFQTNQQKCSSLMSRWHKWGTDEFPGPKYNDTYQRTSGTVCGLDPEFCAISKHKEWADDITQWPICKEPTILGNITSRLKYEHMYCELIGRPCCVGIQGECLITTLEHCKTLRGYFHSDANLCTQVDCMQDVCGMIDFLNVKSPDQVYRLFTSIFIHAGILQLVITILFNIFLLRDLEKLAGSLRIGIIFVGSGIVGNLGSAIFLPYQAEVGPLGSQFGILACHFIELFHAWEYLMDPWLAFIKALITLIILFLIGLLPMIDNFANLFGFLAGLLLAAILFPNFDLKGKVRRTIVIVVCIVTTLLLIAGLIVTFYIKPIEKCEWCKFLSCPLPSSN